MIASCYDFFFLTGQASFVYPSTSGIAASGEGVFIRPLLALLPPVKDNMYIQYENPRFIMRHIEEFSFFPAAMPYCCTNFLD